MEEKEVKIPEPPKFEMPEPPKEVRPEKPMNMNEKMDRMLGKFEMYEQEGESKTKDKTFKLPSKIKKAGANFVKENKINILYLRTNKTAMLKVAKINNGFIYIDGKIYVATPEFVHLLNGKTPFMVINEWCLHPVGTKDYFDALAKGNVADPQVTIIRAIEEAKQIEKASKTLNMKAIIVIGVVLLGAAYILLGQG